MGEPLYLLSESRSGESGVPVAKTLRTKDEVQSALRSARHARWLAYNRQALKLLDFAAEPSRTWHRLLVLDVLPRARRELLSAFFRVVLAPDEGVRLLPREELKEVLGTEHPGDYFIGGIVDAEDQSVVLYSGNLDRLVVPFGWLKATGHSPKPNFDDFEVIDSGQTLRFGSYEAAADAVLYEFDSKARRRMKEREVNQDKSLGSSIRRLRLAKGLSRADFQEVDAKTVARIERGEVASPQRQTLEVLAKRLGVSIGDLGSY